MCLCVYILAELVVGTNRKCWSKFKRCLVEDKHAFHCRTQNRRTTSVEPNVTFPKNLLFKRHTLRNRIIFGKEKYKKKKHFQIKIEIKNHKIIANLNGFYWKKQKKIKIRSKKQNEVELVFNQEKWNWSDDNKTTTTK